MKEEVLNGIVRDGDVDQSVAIDVVGATPSDLPTGTLRSGVRTWIPAGSLISVNTPPSLRKSAQNDPLNEVGGPYARPMPVSWNPWTLSISGVQVM